MSRRDGAIVARHEVPVIMPSQKSRPVGYGMIRAGVRTDMMVGVTKSQIRTFKTLCCIISWPTIQSPFYGKHFLVPERSLRFQHKGTCFGPES